MALSGDKTWTVTRDDIIKAALRKLGVYDSISSATSAELADAALSLNAIVKEWAQEGAGIWLRQTTLVFLTPGRPRYKIGGSSADDNCEITLYRQNKLTSALAAADTVINVDDDTWTTFQGRSIAKNTTGFVGIKMDDDFLDFKPISSVGTDTITVATAFGKTAVAGARIYTYTAKSSRPLRVVYAWREDISYNATPVEIISRTDFESLSRKGGDGDPLKAYYDPQIRDGYGNLFVWPIVNSTTTDKLYLVTEHYPDDFDAATDNPEFPSGWANALIWNLAREMGPEYGISSRTMDRITAIAFEKKMAMFSLDVEDAPVSFAPDAQLR